MGMKSLILDLGFNGGGYLHQAINVADEFLNKGYSLYIRKRLLSQAKFFAQKKGAFQDGEIIVLVNSLQHPLAKL